MEWRIKQLIRILQEISERDTGLCRAHY